MKSNSFLFLLIILVVPGIAVAKDCWQLSDLKGHVAMSVNNYAFKSDTENESIRLCFEGQVGSVTGEGNMKFIRVGYSTLVGVAVHNGMEAVESYQIDRAHNVVLFTQSRIGTNITGLDAVAALKGRAEPVSHNP